MMVVGVIAVLALLAAPSISDKFVRDQVVEAAKLIEFAKPPIQVSWATLATLPVDNASAGLPPAASIVNNFVSSVAVESGAIQVTFGNHANAALRGKMLSFRPGVVEASPIVPITWVCGHASPPVPMNARGLDKTNIPDRYLPLNCRPLPVPRRLPRRVVLGAREAALIGWPRDRASIVRHRLCAAAPCRPRRPVAGPDRRPQSDPGLGDAARGGAGRRS